MQRVSALLPTWDRNANTNNVNNKANNHARKHSLDKVRGWADKIPSSVNRLSSSSRVGREAFLPSTLDKECEKAARILRSFCDDGFLAPDDRPGSPHTFSSNDSSSKLVKRIPPRIIQNAVGLAIFTSTRSGLWASGSGGSGVLIARKTDGSWSPPSGLMLQTASLGFVIGVDVCDCVLVINNFTVLEIFGRQRLTLGTDVQLTGGPLLTLGLTEHSVGWADLSDTVITYVKAKGQAADVKIDGTILIERSDENERFYGMSMSVAKILAGDINQSLPQTRPLTEMLKAAEGRTDYDVALLEQLAALPAPADAVFESPAVSRGMSPAFGVPDADDPDPFGVLALEMAGMEIREAGTRLRPESSQFDYSPSPTSPMFPKISRRSVDTYTSRSNRGSYMSNKTMATERSHVTDVGTQTFVHTPETTPCPSQSQSEDGHPSHQSDDIPEVREPEDVEPVEPVEVDYTKIDISALRKLTNFPDLDDEPSASSSTKDQEQVLNALKDGTDEVSPTPVLGENEQPRVDLEEDDDMDLADGEEEDDDEEDFDDDDEFEDAEEPVIFEVATAQAPQRLAVVASQVVQAKGAVVNIPRRMPPPLPTRSPARTSRRKSQMNGGDLSMVSSPLRQEFDAGADGGEVSTPTAQDITVSPISDDTDGIVADKQISPLEDEIESQNIELPPTPTLDPKTSEDYFPEIEKRASQQDVRVTQTSPPAEEKTGFTSNPGVAVPVA